MNRHILGLSVFLVIVKSTFLLYWGFFAPKPFVSFLENETYTQSEPNIKTSCFPISNNLNKITYAEFDAKTETLRMTVRVNDKSALITSENKILVYLSLGADNGFQASGVLVGATPVYQNGYTELKVETTLYWLDKRDLQRRNLYVIAQVPSSEYCDGKQPGGFKTESVPVLFSH